MIYILAAIWLSTCCFIFLKRNDERKQPTVFWLSAWATSVPLIVLVTDPTTYNEFLSVASILFVAFCLTWYLRFNKNWAYITAIVAPSFILVLLSLGLYIISCGFSECAGGEMDLIPVMLLFYSVIVGIFSFLSVVITLVIRPHLKKEDIVRGIVLGICSSLPVVCLYALNLYSHGILSWFT